MALLEIKDLTIDFATVAGNISVVQNISFNLCAGETLAIVGESGCGKSISALSLLGLLPSPIGKVAQGSALFQGRDLFVLKQKELCHIRGKDIAMIFQEPMTSLNPVMQIGHQIAEPLRKHLGVKKKEALEQARQLLEKVKINDAGARMRAYPHQLSGGMRQRVMIAMALACRPKIIIADEPTTALDVTVQAELLNLMKTLTREAQTALILITHNLGVVARYADRMNVMYAGKIVEKGTALDLYRNPRHPYTLGLLESIPRIDDNLNAKLRAIPGQPPDCFNLSKGCAFYPRCRFRIAKCANDSPLLEPVTGSHQAACWATISRRAFGHA